ncbi:hypothetical protein K7X08_025528 [Anisodus acutangulus]|uniref:Isovaleryl-CoA dehydrogenase n=1 Tax=Anisodus acutangulus TaxID=402998 RepID=A0A9Q1LSU2_9SOLA|nr:hypothetical protein K7X08_025528 [Anisodus acutangulus]
MFLSRLCSRVGLALALISFHLRRLGFKESVAQFAQENIAPHAEKIDRTNHFPKDVDLWKLMGDFNLHGITVPALSHWPMEIYRLRIGFHQLPIGYGGLGLGYLYHCIAVEEISRASGSVGLSYGAHTNLCINQLLISREHVGALAMSEPNAGSDVVSMKCKADRVEGGYVLNGNKMWCTNGPTAQTLVIYACKNRCHSWFERNHSIHYREGNGRVCILFSTAQKLDKLGMRGSDTCELVFENCFVPEEIVLGQVGKENKFLLLQEFMSWCRGSIWKDSFWHLVLLELCKLVSMLFSPMLNNENNLGDQLENFNLYREKLRTCTRLCNPQDRISILLQGNVTAGHLLQRIVLVLYCLLLKEQPKLLFRLFSALEAMAT